MRFLTAGESHGKGLVAILEGFPAGVKISIDKINQELERRQKGFGRGKRMEIEKDKVKVISGIKNGKTFGSPIALFIRNKDFSINTLPEVISPRPGHADLVGGLKYGFKDLRLALERASARETAARVSIGGICKQFLENFSIRIFSHTLMVGGIWVKNKLDYKVLEKKVENSLLRIADKEVEKKIINLIKKAEKKGDSLGGVFETVALGVPSGLGSYVHWDRRLDGLLAQAIMSIPGVKAVEIGDGIKVTEKFGSSVHDEIFYEKRKGFYRKTNRAGGIEGGISNGMPIIIRGYMKPIATLRSPLASVNIKTKEKTKAKVERSDICVVPSAGIISEAMMAIVITNLFLEKFGNDEINEIKTNFKNYIKKIKEY
jgi:chorismate synthase